MDFSWLQAKFSLFHVSQTNDLVNETFTSTAFQRNKTMMAKAFF